LYYNAEREANQCCSCGAEVPEKYEAYLKRNDCAKDLVLHSK
jgi:DNA-directed RNA polymerase subunit N (RpoN/RPB10)